MNRHRRMAAIGTTAALLTTACGGEAEVSAQAPPAAASVDWPDHVGTRPAEEVTAADLCATVEATVLEVVPDAGPAEPHDELGDGGERVLTCHYNGDLRSIVVAVTSDPSAWEEVKDPMLAFGTFRGQPGIVRQGGASFYVRAHNGWTVKVTNLTPEKDPAVSGIVAEAALDALDPFGPPVDDARPGAEFDRTLAESVVADAPPVAAPRDDPSWAQAVCEGFDADLLAPFFVAEVPPLTVDVGIDAGAPVRCHFMADERQVEIVVHWASTQQNAHASARKLDVDGHTAFLGESGGSAGVEDWLHLPLTRDVQGLDIYLDGFAASNTPTDEEWRAVVQGLLAAWEAA